MTIKQIIQSRIDILPEQKQAEVLNFLNFLIASQTEIDSQQESNIQPKRQRVLGLNKGQISMSDDFNAPLPDEFFCWNVFKFTGVVVVDDGCILFPILDAKSSEKTAVRGLHPDYTSPSALACVLQELRITRAFVRFFV